MLDDKEQPITQNKWVERTDWYIKIDPVMCRKESANLMQ